MFGSSVKVFDCIDVHCEGEPARVVVGGFPLVKGKTMAEKRIEIINEHKDSCRLLLRVIYQAFCILVVRHMLI
jgi:proline racemase